MLATVPGIILAVVTLIGILAALVAMGRASFAKAQIEALRGDRDDLLKRVDMLEHENLRVAEQFKTEREARQALEKVVTGREQLEHLQSTIDAFVIVSGEWRAEQRKLALDILGLHGARREGEKQS